MTQHFEFRITYYMVKAYLQIFNLVLEHTTCASIVKGLSSTSTDPLVAYGIRVCASGFSQTRSIQFTLNACSSKKYWHSNSDLFQRHKVEKMLILTAHTVLLKIVVITETDPVATVCITVSTHITWFTTLIQGDLRN